MKVWVAGPRSWENQAPVEIVLRKLEARYGLGRLVVVSGGAPGVDHLVDKVCRERGIHMFGLRANWSVWNRAAGPIRNRLIAELFAPDLLVAFHYLDLTAHVGTRNAVRRAKSLEIPVRLIRVAEATANPSAFQPGSPGVPKARGGKTPRKRG